MNHNKLYIIRHAKAEDHGLKKNDFDRDLIDKGRQRAKVNAERLKQEIQTIDERTLVISSTASRAAETAEIFCTILEYPLSKIQWEPNIYEAHYLIILKRINDVSSQYNRLLLFGHNPGLSDLISYISDEYVNLKTSHVGCLELEDGINFSILSANTSNFKKLIDV